MKKFLTILIAMVAMASCKVCDPIIETIEKERVVEVHTRDTAFVTTADSASVRALLRCDSAYNVVLWELSTIQGERIEVDATAQKQGNDLLLSLGCKEDSLIQVIQLQDSIIRTSTNQTLVREVKVLPSFYKNCTIAMWIMVVLLILLIVARILFKIYLHK